MKRGQEKAVINWLKSNCGKVVLPHIGVVREIEEIGAINDNRKKGDVYINGESVSFKDVESSFLYNRLHRSFFVENPNFKITWFDQQVDQVHHSNKKRNVPWQNSMTRSQFKSMLRMLMMDMNPKTGISNHPAQYILTHPKKVAHAVDIALFTFDEFFDLFADNWITYAFLRCWYGQGKDGGDSTEHNRAQRIIKSPIDSIWSFPGVSGKGPTHWRSDVKEDERKTCFTCSIEVKSPAKWDDLREFRQSLLDSGFFGVDSAILEKIIQSVQEKFGSKLISKRNDKRWREVLEIADAIANKK